MHSGKVRTEKVPGSYFAHIISQLSPYSTYNISVRGGTELGEFGPAASDVISLQRYAGQQPPQEQETPPARCEPTAPSAPCFPRKLKIECFPSYVRRFRFSRLPHLLGFCCWSLLFHRSNFLKFASVFLNYKIFSLLLPTTRSTLSFLLEITRINKADFLYSEIILWQTHYLDGFEWKPF